MVDLGFLEKSDGKSLSPLFFPSKVGGKPAWLSCKELPSAEDLTCETCGQIMIFLLQVYAPNESNEDCFHRTIFMFCCKNGTCYANSRKRGNNFRIFRSQLSRENEFYSRDATPDDISEEELEEKNLKHKDTWLRSLCDICGCFGSKVCGSCKNSRYCSKEHQILDWKEAHSKTCSKSTQESKEQSSWPFPEFELVTEPEVEKSPDITPTEDDRMKAYETFVASKHSELSCQNMADEEIQKFIDSHKSQSLDNQFQKFKERMYEPEQVLRYNLGGEPLWVSAKNIPTESDIPHCYCGAKRQFEFQVLPQLLYYLKVESLDTDTIDWGTIAVYTCTANCTKGLHYRREFVWEQDFTNQEVED